jgi:hypothetical protein
MGGIHASAFMNTNRDPKKHRAPIVLPMPWPSEEAEEEITPEERARLRSLLKSRSAFAD